MRLIEMLRSKHRPVSGQNAKQMQNVHSARYFALSVVCNLKKRQKQLKVFKNFYHLCSSKLTYAGKEAILNIHPYASSIYFALPAYLTSL